MHLVVYFVLPKHKKGPAHSLRLKYCVTIVRQHNYKMSSNAICNHRPCSGSFVRNIISYYYYYNIVLLSMINLLSLFRIQCLR